MTFDLYLMIADEALQAWRIAHPDDVVHGDDVLIAQPLGYVAGRAHGRVYGSWEDGVIDLAEPTRRAVRVAAATAMVRNSILPWFAETAEPDTLVTKAPPVTIWMSAVRIIEWLASLERRDLIGYLVGRILAYNPKLRDGVERGRPLASRAERPPGGDLAAGVGWATAIHAEP